MGTEKVLFVDLAGTLAFHRTDSKGNPIMTPAFKNIKSVLKKLRANGIRIIIVTNDRPYVVQAIFGIEHVDGVLSSADFDGARKMKAMRLWDKRNDKGRLTLEKMDRLTDGAQKGLLMLDYIRKNKVLRKNCFFVGDQQSDKNAAEVANVKFEFARRAIPREGKKAVAKPFFGEPKFLEFFNPKYRMRKLKP